jgi:DNA-binding XRE family transcriptional regulator
MSIHPQFILQKGAPIYVILSYKEYEMMLEALEDKLDLIAIEENKKDSSERFPLEFVEQLASGKNRVKAYREYRKYSQTKLAKLAGVSKQYISQIETGERAGSTKTMKKIAKALKVDLDDLVE